MTTVTMINAFEVPEVAVERFLREWPEDLAFMRRQPGFEAGTLYRNRDAGGRFAFINVSRWRGEADFRAARDGLAAHWREQGTSERGQAWSEAGIRMTPGLFDVALEF
jgi:heme-degrading monooxygenase HmoA